MSVGRICVREVDIAESDESVQVAAQRMHARKVGTLVVVDAARAPIGIVTDRDQSLRILRAAGSWPLRRNSRNVGDEATSRAAGASPFNRSDLSNS